MSKCADALPDTGSAQEWKHAVEHGELFGYVVSLAGPALACRAAWEPSRDGPRGKLVYSFARGITLTAEVMPPETGDIRVEAPGGLGDEEGVRAFMRRWAEKSGLNVDWTKPETRTEGSRTTKTYWDPSPGLNGGVDEVWLAGKLIGLGLHVAL